MDGSLKRKAGVEAFNESKRIKEETSCSTGAQNGEENSKAETETLSLQEEKFDIDSFVLAWPDINVDADKTSGFLYLANA